MSLVAVLLPIAAPVFAQSARAVAMRAAVPPAVDGHLDDPAWRAAPPVGDFVQHEPHDGAPPTERSSP